LPGRSQAELTILTETFRIVCEVDVVITLIWQQFHLALSGLHCDNFFSDPDVWFRGGEAVVVDGRAAATSLPRVGVTLAVGRQVILSRVAAFQCGQVPVKQTATEVKPPAVDEVFRRLAVRLKGHLPVCFMNFEVVASVVVK
jgi:hypothetical protein